MDSQEIERSIRIADLIFRSLRENLTPDEQGELNSWIIESEKNRNMYDELTHSGLREDMTALSSFNVERARKRLAKKIQPRGRLIAIWALRYASAAAVLIILVAGYFLVTKKSPITVSKPVVVNAPANDITAPEKVHAILTLADGKTVILDSVNNGQLVSGGNANIMKLSDGHLVYRGQSVATDEMQYNTLTVPRGSKIVELTLSDGTNVTLNSASSITYPTSFSGKNRQVKIEGEAYFEVAHDHTKPFIVQKGDAKVEVLGTHFNINAYDDEDAIAVTLLEGSVKVSSRQASGNIILRPGQMARVKQRIDVLRDVNLGEVMAWKEGKFRFGESTDIGTIMRQIARWYDLHIVYQGNITGHLGGTINREANVSEVLKILEMTGAAHFSVQDNKVIVQSK
jgi:ferric-dicitrate binding protein FerR (iron transport regulator)